MTPRREQRGQVVVLAAVVLAVALVTMTAAYHGLGYHGDVDATAERSAVAPVSVAEERLQRSVNEVAVGGGVPWENRSALVDETRGALTVATDGLQREGQARRVSYVVREDASAAEAWAEDDCPSGAFRAFGPCLAQGGIVVQERANETVLVGVAVEVSVRTASSETTAAMRLAAR